MQDLLLTRISICSSSGAQPPFHRLTFYGLRGQDGVSSQWMQPRFIDVTCKTRVGSGQRL